MEGSRGGVEGCCRFYLEDQRMCKAGFGASLISHLHLFAFLCSFIHSVDVRQPKKLKATPEALSFALHTSSSGLKKLIPVISRKRSLRGQAFTVTLQTPYMRAEQFAQRSRVTSSPPYPSTFPPLWHQHSPKFMKGGDTHLLQCSGYPSKCVWGGCARSPIEKQK